MKHTLFTAVLLIVALCSKNASAQTALPYYSGFDNATEKAGWTEYRKGVTTTFNWVAGASTHAVSAPNALSHDYPVGAATTDTTVDWYVSPGFSFPAGGKIDSFRINVFTMSGSLSPEDSLVIYLLKGSPDPSLATARIRLADLTVMAAHNDTMKDTGNIVIPPVTGTAYIAFKYQAVYDWFVPTIDNIHISKNPTTGIERYTTAAGAYICPNPATNAVKMVFGDKTQKDATIHIFNMLGQIVMQQDFSQITDTLDADVSALAPGTYYLQIAVNTTGIFSFELIKR